MKDAPGRSAVFNAGEGWEMHLQIFFKLTCCLAVLSEKLSRSGMGTEFFLQMWSFLVSIAAADQSWVCITRAVLSLFINMAILIHHGKVDVHGNQSIVEHWNCTLAEWFFSHKYSGELAEPRDLQYRMGATDSNYPTGTEW